MKKIGFFTTRFLDLSETFIYEPLRLIKDYDVFVYALQRRNADRFPYDKVSTQDDLPQKKQKWNSFLGDIGKEKYLFSKMQQNKIELLHAHYGYMGIYALQYKKKLKIPLVTSFYGLDVYQHTKNPLYRKQLKRLFAKGDLFLVCSQRMREDLIAFGAPASRTLVQYGGAAMDKFPFSYLSPEEGPPTILMCGRFVEKKGFEYGIKAFLGVAKEFQDYKLKIIGSGKLESKLKSIVAESPFRDQVEFLGSKSHQEYIDEIKRCHIFMSPSVTAASGDKEGLPTVLIEAAALGKPLIATDHSGISEILHDKKNGFITFEKDVCGLENAIRKMINNNYKWIEFAEYGRALVEKEFDMRKQTLKLEKHYKELLVKF